MKRFSKKISSWGLAGLGFILAVITFCGYKMFAVVYGPRPVDCVYGPPPFEISDNDSLKNDSVNNAEHVLNDFVNTNSSITIE